MRVSGANIFTYNNPQSIQMAKSKPLKFYQPLTYDKFQKSLPFTAISTHGEFRALTRNHIIHCPYCRKPMFYKGILDEMLKSGVFSGNIKNFIEVMEPYKTYLKRGHRTVFQQIKKYAQTSPQTHLEEIITDLYHKSINKLVKSQAQIFKSLILESENLPETMKPSFRKFMKIQHKRLYEIPYVEPFNNNTFAYKIGKMANSISNENFKIYLQNLSKAFENPIFKNREAIVPKELGDIITGKPQEHLQTSEDYLRYGLKQVRKIGERIGRQELIRLCENSQKMLDGKPVVINFNNKGFLRPLILEELKDIKGTPLYYKMIEIAKQLPNSQSHMKSFVAKHRYSDADTIGYKLIEPSLTTLEHIKERASGGVDDLQNCALACKADNNERGSIPQFEYLKKWNSRNPQRYFYDLIDITNNEHLINPSDIEGMAQSFLNEGKVQIDISKLKR